MKPTSPRTTRRAAAKSKGGALTIADLGTRVQSARVARVDKARLERARRLLLAYLSTAHSHGLPVKDVVREMVDGQTAWRISMAIRDEIIKAPPPQVRDADCAQGCAFCCILTGGDGGVITASEATRLRQALQPLAGRPDGRDWHPNACPALDPETRSCRAYDARPMICRSFISTDARACEANAEGAAEHGAGLLGNHLDYLLVHSLCRAALKGIAQVPTYSLAQTAALGVAGQDDIAPAKQKSTALDTACQDGVAAAQGI